MSRRSSSVLRFYAQHGNPETARVVLPGLLVVALVGLVARFAPGALAAAALAAAARARLTRTATAPPVSAPRRAS